MRLRRYQNERTFIMDTQRPQVSSFKFHGAGSELFVLILKNIFFTLISLGIYTPWAKTNFRKFLVNNLEMAEHRFIYTGTGKELFFSYLKVLGIYLAASVSISILGAFDQRLSVALLIGLGVVVLFAIPHLRWGALRYRLSRTRWMGIRFGLDDSGKSRYVRNFYRAYLFVPMTLGFYFPIFRFHSRKAIMDSLHLGTARFQYDGVKSDELSIWLKGLFLSVFTLGIYSFWNRVERMRYVWQRTRFIGVQGRLTLTGGTLFGLTAGAAVGGTLSLGLAFPWLSVWVIQSLLRETSLEGALELSSIQQAPERGNATADSWADVLDVDV